MDVASVDLSAIELTLKLATIVTVLLLILGTPIAWWLARTRSKLKGIVGALVALPLVLPPTVLGFYMLLTLGPNSPIGRLTEAIGIGLLPFTFPGLVITSVVYSMPFVVQPVQNTFLFVGYLLAVNPQRFAAANSGGVVPVLSSAAVAATQESASWSVSAESLSGSVPLGNL